MKTRLTYIVLFLLYLPNICSASIWQKKIINYERSEYQAGFQNWKAIQSKEGWIYFANTKGLLEFDGVNWSLYSMGNKTVRTLNLIGEKIFVGGSSEFGYFKANKKGLLTYTSMSANLSEWGGEIWNILASKDKLYFLDENNVLIFDLEGKFISMIPSPGKIATSAYINDTLYLGTSVGLLHLEKDQKTFKNIDPTNILVNRKIISILPYKNKILITTALDGLYFLENQTFEKINLSHDNLINQNQLFCTSTSGDFVILGTVQNGVFILDLTNPQYIEHFNMDKGLKNNTILSSFVDKNQNLWLGLDKGISYIDLNSPVEPLYAKDSPIGTGYCSAFYNGELYLGTNQGLYKMDSQGKHHIIKGGEGQIWSFFTYDNSLFCSGDNGVIVISGQQTYKIDLPGVWEIHPIRADKDKLIAGKYSGLSILLKENNIWKFSHDIPDFYNSGRGFIEDDVDYSFWLIGIGEADIQKITLDKNPYWIIDKKNYKLGAPMGDNVYFRKIDNNIVICTLDGIYQYSRISDEFTHYTQLENLLEGQKYYEYLSTDNKNNLWYVSDKNLKMLPYRQGGYAKDAFNWGLTNELIDSYENIVLIDSASAMIGVDKGFSKIDFTKKIKDEPINVFIRKIGVNQNDSIISYGQPQERIELSYMLNSVSIHFAATEYSQASDVVYSCRLVGLDDTWSIPSSKTVKEYTNLPEGKYTFEVKAFIRGEKESENITSIEFEILPPWYRSIWAYLFYTVSMIILLFVLYKKTIDKQKKIINQNRQELVAQRKKHEEESRQKDQEIYKLQNEKLRSDLDHKTQELTGYMLNITRKNEMLDDVKKSVVNVLKTIDENGQISQIKQKIIRLITQINNNIEHDNDFEVFQSNFDIVHQGFFKLLDEKYPKLTRNDKVLCAYLKMNLSTKEIAPLLNISIRGVEVNRYRLRKKMNLDRDINLTEYLQTLSQEEENQ